MTDPKNEIGKGPGVKALGLFWRCHPRDFYTAVARTLFIGHRPYNETAALVADQKQRLQQLFFPEGVRFDGKRLVGTGTTLPVFNYLNPIFDEKKDLVDQTGIEPVTS